MARHDAGRHESPAAGTSYVVPAVTVLGVALLVLVMVLVGRQLSTNGTSSGTPSRPGATSPVAAASTSGTLSAAQRQAVSMALDTCRLTNLRQQTDLSAAAVSLGLWRKHVDAMNLLVAGKISLAVAQDFWASSRIGAMKSVADFWVADQAYTAGKTSTCAPLGPTLAPAATPAQSAALASCAKALPPGDVALARARTAVATWEHHVHDMEALRVGQITPAQATAKWQKNWQAGNAELMRYDAAVAAASATCPLH